MDFHAHVDLYEDPTSLIKQIQLKGIYVLSVTTTPTAFLGTKKLARGSRRIRTALGLHPQLAQDRTHELALFDRLIGETDYVGEIGLDGASEYRSSLKEQRVIFHHILDSCEVAGGKVLSIHSRGAAAEVIDTLKSRVKYSTAILHWFSGSEREVYDASLAGNWFSVGPAMLQSQRQRQKVALLPRNRVLLESDGPFAKYKGQTLSPLNTVLAVPVLSEIWNVDEDAVVHQLQQNLTRIGAIATQGIGFSDVALSS